MGPGPLTAACKGSIAVSARSRRGLKAGAELNGLMADEPVTSPSASIRGRRAVPLDKDDDNATSLLSAPKEPVTWGVRSPCHLCYLLLERDIIKSWILSSPMASDYRHSEHLRLNS